MPFPKGENPNRPKKGEKIKVEPIKERRYIKRIKKQLENNPRDYCIFVLGINTAFRAGDLLSIKVADVSSLKAGDSFEIKEKKTGHNRRVTLNGTCVEAIKYLLKSRDFEDKDYLFLGQRGRFTVSSVSNLVKQCCRRESLKGNFGSHTLRKTWGYHQRVTFNTHVSILMDAFGHATQKQTLEYLCIQPEEIKNVYLNEL